MGRDFRYDTESEPNMRPSSPVSELVERLSTMAGIIEMGERISWGSDSAIMDEAASTLTTLSTRNAELEAQLAERVKVRSLEWSPVEEWKGCSRERAPAFGGEYQIVMLDPGEGELPSLYFEIGLGAFMFRFEQDQDPMGLPGETAPKKFPSVEEAKAAAQADYEHRILSALEATPPAPKVTRAQADLIRRIVLPMVGERSREVGDAWDKAYHILDAITAAQEAGR